MPLQATVVIATIGRADLLERALAGWRLGTRTPIEVRVVDASTDSTTHAVCRRDWSPLRVTHMASPVRSAAQQRNLGAAHCATEIVVFCDDDVELPADALEHLLAPFERDTAGSVGGVAGTIVGLHHAVPSRLLRWYYRLQAGYAHPHYGGQFFGAGINILPSDEPTDPEWYPSQWLNSTLVAYRTDLFAAQQFPNFDGYSFQEDVNLSFRIGRTHALYFNRRLRYVHLAAKGEHKAHARRLAAMMFENRWANATELLLLRGLGRQWKFGLSLIFDVVCLIRARPAQWPLTALGLAAAWWRLAVLGRRSA